MEEKPIPLSDLLRRYGVELRRNGREWAGRCPFHPDSTPSLYVSDEKGVYYCFGCGASGDHITFLRELEGLDYRGALGRLYEIAGLPLPHDWWGEGERQKRKELEELARQAASLFRRSPAERYWLQRGLPPELAHTLGVGYLLPDSAHPLAGRLILPLRDRQTLLLVGRALGGQKPKYLFHPPGVRRGSLLPVFNPGRRPLWVVEGALDAAMLLAHLPDVAVAPILSAIPTPAQASRIASGGWPEVVVALDSDEAGQRGAVRFLDYLRGLVPLRVAVWETGKDPGEASPEELRRKPQSLLEPHDFLWGLAQPLGVQGGLRLLSPFLSPRRPADPIPGPLAALLRQAGWTTGEVVEPTLQRLSPPARRAQIEVDMAALVVSLPPEERLPTLDWLESLLYSPPLILEALRLGGEEWQQMAERSALWARLAALPPMSPQDVKCALRTLARRYNLGILSSRWAEAVGRGDYEAAGRLAALIEAAKEEKHGLDF